MATVVKEKYSRIRKGIEYTMKVVQRDLENGRLKVEFLSTLLDLRERLDKDGRESSGQTEE